MNRAEMLSLVVDAQIKLEGRQPPELTATRLYGDIPLDWTEQRRVFGISAH